ACEFHKYSVADDPHYPPVKFLDVGLDERVPMCLPPGERAFVVIFDEATVPSNVGCKNGRELSFRSSPGLAKLNAVNPHWSCDVFQLLLADILVSEINSSADLFVNFA